MLLRPHRFAFYAVALGVSLLPGLARSAPSFDVLAFGAISFPDIQVSADGSTAASSGASGVGFASRHNLTTLGQTSLASANNVTTPGLSADGSVVMGSATDGFGVWQTYRRVGATQTNVLANSATTSVSSDGSRYAGTLTQVNQAFVATHGVTPVVTPLGDLPGGATASFANGISGDGLVVVGVSGGASGNEAFRWDAGSGMVGLGDLAGGGFASQAFDISLDGSTIVGVGTSASGSEAFRWQGGVMTGLGDLPGGGFSSRANGVSGDGSIVVGSATGAPGATGAFIWDSTNGMRLLKDYLEDVIGLDIAGFELGSALDISADGKTIVGMGSGIDPTSIYFGNTVYWVATIPEPGTASLLAMGLGGIAGLRRASASSRRG